MSRPAPKRVRILIRLPLLVAATVVLLPRPVPACGPFYDAPTIINSSKEDLLLLPSARFYEELERLTFPKAEFSQVDSHKKSSDQTETNLLADLADLTAELKLKGVPEGSWQPLFDNVKAVRTQFASYAEKYAVWNVQKKGPPPAPPDVQVDLHLPQQFHDYLCGWAAYQNNRPDEARKHWLRLLTLPAADRQWRSVWAAYMIGRSYQSEPAEAIKWFAKTRELARGGAKDTLGLEYDSYGWEARAELDRKHFARAIELYATVHDSTSLQDTAIAVFEAGPDVLPALAKDPTSSAVLTAYVVSKGGPWREAPTAELVRAWLAAVEAADVKRVDGAGRFAWSAYEYGHYDLAARWLAKADMTGPMAQWIAAKLMMRDGKVDEALKLLAGAAKAFPPASKPEDDWHAYDRDPPLPAPPKRVLGEIGALKLARSQYVEALDLLLKGDYWPDAAYLGEHVLTADELKAYVDKNAPADQRPEKPEGIRRLLGRRLLRLGRWKDARPYFNADQQKTLDSYIADIRAGHDKTRSDIDRGRSLWSAARTIRAHGMELLGTEFGPDVHFLDGSIEWTDGIAERRAVDNAMVAPGADELKRLKKPPEHLEKRFQYRYTAADHAWAAAQLMPDNTDELAECLNRGGSWLKNRDPIGAQRFYEALAKRCPTTKMGQHAIAKKWFVAVKDE